MTTKEASARAEFWKAVRWIAVLGVVLVVGVLTYLASVGPVRTHMVVATIGGVFISTLLGCGLFAAGFYSDKSGHDDDVTNATRDVTNANRRGE